MYTKCSYTECIQNIYHISTDICIPFVYKIKRNMPAKFCIQKYTKCIQKFVEMWYTFCTQTFCTHFVYINSELQKVYLINIMYTICIQNSYRMYIQIIVCRMVLLFQHIVRLICCALPSYSLQTIRPKTYNLLANHGRYLLNQWINGLYIALNCQ